MYYTIIKLSQQYESMSNQKAITSFFSTTNGETNEHAFATTNDGLKKVCPVCLRSFYPQGFIQHLRTHPEGSTKYRRPPTGSVKIRGNPYKTSSRNSYETNDIINEEIIQSSSSSDESSSKKMELPPKRRKAGGGRRLKTEEKLQTLDYYQEAKHV